MIFCPDCGAQNEDIYRFCHNCGTKLPAKSHIPPQPGVSFHHDRKYGDIEKVMIPVFLCFLVIIIVGLGSLILIAQKVEPNGVTSASSKIAQPGVVSTPIPSQTPEPTPTLTPTRTSTGAPTDPPFRASPIPRQEQGLIIRDYFNGKLTLYDWRSETVIWEKYGYSGGLGIVKQNNGNLMIASKSGWLELDQNGNRVNVHHPPPGGGYILADGTFISQETCGGGDVIHYDAAGNALWTASGLHCVQDAYLIENGNILIADGSSVVREFDNHGDLVWTGRGSQIVWTARRLWNGMTLISERGYLEFLDENGALTKPRIGEGNFQDVEVLPDGNFLAGDRDNGKIFVFSPDGSILWKMTGLDTFTVDFLP